MAHVRHFVSGSVDHESVSSTDVAGSVSVVVLGAPVAVGSLEPVVVLVLCDGAGAGAGAGGGVLDWVVEAGCCDSVGGGGGAGSWAGWEPGAGETAGFALCLRRFATRRAKRRLQCFDELCRGRQMLSSAETRAVAAMS